MTNAAYIASAARGEMIVLEHFEISAAAPAVLERRQSKFRPTAGSVLALAYLANIAASDGSTVEGFLPGFAILGWPRSDLSAGCAKVSLGKNGELFLIPRYVMDLASLEHRVSKLGSGLN